MRSVVSTNKAPGAIGPYSQAIKIDNLVYTSGQIPIDPTTGDLVKGDVKTEATQVLNNLKAVLEAAGSSMDKVIKTLVFITDMNDFAAVNEVYAEFFTGECPARSCVAVKQLPKDAKIEIEAIALL